MDSTEPIRNLVEPGSVYNNGGPVTIPKGPYVNSVTGSIGNTTDSEIRAGFDTGSPSFGNLDFSSIISVIYTIQYVWPKSKVGLKEISKSDNKKQFTWDRIIKQNDTFKSPVDLINDSIKRLNEANEFSQISDYAARLNKLNLNKSKWKSELTDLTKCPTINSISNSEVDCVTCNELDLTTGKCKKVYPVRASTWATENKLTTFCSTDGLANKSGDSTISHEDIISNPFDVTLSIILAPISEINLQDNKEPLKWAKPEDGAKKVARAGIHTVDYITTANWIYYITYESSGPNATGIKKLSTTAQSTLYNDFLYTSKEISEQTDGTDFIYVKNDNVNSGKSTYYIKDVLISIPSGGAIFARGNGPINKSSIESIVSNNIKKEFTYSNVSLVVSLVGRPNWNHQPTYSSGSSNIPLGGENSDWQDHIIGGVDDGSHYEPKTFQHLITATSDTVFVPYEPGKSLSFNGTTSIMKPVLYNRSTITMDIYRSGTTNNAIKQPIKFIKKPNYLNLVEAMNAIANVYRESGIQVTPKMKIGMSHYEGPSVD